MLDNLVLLLVPQTALGTVEFLPETERVSELFWHLGPTTYVPVRHGLMEGNRKGVPVGAVEHSSFLKYLERRDCRSPHLKHRQDWLRVHDEK